jgi:hypothetical protein
MDTAHVTVMSPDPNQHSTTDVRTLTPDTTSNATEFLTLFGSLFSVGTGIALFTAGNTPSGLPIPVISLVFIAAGLLFWFGAALERQH